MGILGNTINKGIDAATGSNSGTTLYDFLSKFTSSAGKFVDQIDPLTTFDVSIQFFPTDPSEEDDSNDLDILNALGTAATSAIKNLGDNLTGGLLTSILAKGQSVTKARREFDKKGDDTFIEYLVLSHMLVGGENWFADQSAAPLELLLGPYVQSVTIPLISMVDGGRANTLLGEIPVNGSYVKPESNELIMNIVNTKASLHERIFYPWMREVTLPYWAYRTLPYTTATITIDYTKHNDVKYVFCGCRPNKIFTLLGNQDTSGGDNILRQVTFLFDFMYVTSLLDVVESVEDKLLSTGKALLGSATKTMNI